MVFRKWLYGAGDPGREVSASLTWIAGGADRDYNDDYKRLFKMSEEDRGAAAPGAESSDEEDNAAVSVQGDEGNRLVQLQSEFLE